MICVTIGRTRHKHMQAEYLHLADIGAGMVEMRLDFIGRTVDLKRLLEDRRCPIVMTCRRKQDGGQWEKTEEERQMLLRSAIVAGVDYVDIEEDIAAKIPRYGRTKRVISLHDFDGTPEDLDQIHARLAKLDADVVKIATMANSFADTIRMLRLVQSSPLPTIGISMGDFGTVTRILGPRFGAPWSYATISTERRIAPGQLSFKQMRDIYRVDKLNAETKLYGVVADPVAHSLSPNVHNAMFEAEGVNCCYVPFRIPSDELPMFVTWCRQFGIGGLSVTIPHKEQMVGLVDQAEAAVSEIGALNTVVFANETATGFNTDYRAAMDCLIDKLAVPGNSSEPFRDMVALVLGAGGAARAIAFGLRQRGATVNITSRTTERAEELARSVGGGVVPWNDRYGARPAIIVNTTPVGMHPNIDETPFDRQHLRREMVVFDTVYNPETTLLIKGAREVGCKTITGVDMFVRQAAYQYKLFTGRDANREVMQKAVQKAISAVNY